MEKESYLLQYGFVILIAIFTFMGQSDARELRPSEHGSIYQDSSSPMKENRNHTQQMLSFFRAAATSVPLPETKNFSDPTTWWSSRAVGGSHGVHLRTPFLLASLICGVIGIVLLAVAGILFLFRLRKQKQQKLSATASNAFVDK